MGTTFSPALLNNWDDLKGFFNPAQALNEINCLPKSAYVEPKEGRLYYNARDIVQIVLVAPFRWITFLVLGIFSFLTICFHRVSTKFKLMARSFSRVDENLINQMIYGTRLLQPTRNDYSHEHSDLYGQESIYKSQLKLPILKNNLHYNLDEVNFNLSDKGICHGAVNWFNFLVLKGLDTDIRKKTNSSEYLRAVSTQFEYGQPKQSGLIQSLYGLEASLLDFEYDGNKVNSIEELVSELRNYTNGVFYVQIDKHAVSYIKIAGEEFVWDPNIGLLKIITKFQLKEHLKSWSKDSPKEMFFLKTTLAQIQINQSSS